MFMSFEIVSLCVWLWYFFSEMCRTAAYAIPTEKQSNRTHYDETELMTHRQYELKKTSS